MLGLTPAITIDLAQHLGAQVLLNGKR